MATIFEFVISDCGNVTVTNANAETPIGTTYGEVALISCNDGYTRSGDSFVTCTAAGNWSTLPTCNLIGIN